MGKKMSTTLPFTWTMFIQHAALEETSLFWRKYYIILTLLAKYFPCCNGSTSVSISTAKHSITSQSVFTNQSFMWRSMPMPSSFFSKAKNKSGSNMHCLLCIVHWVYTNYGRSVCNPLLKLVKMSSILPIVLKDHSSSLELFGRVI